MSMRDDLSKFGLKTLPAESTLKKLFAEIAMQHHPDRGGDPSIFDQYRKAYDRLLKILRKPTPCRNCEGKGQVLSMDGWNVVEFPCDVCDGKGSTIKDQRVEDLCDELDRLLGDREEAEEVLEVVKKRLRRL